MQKVGIVNFHFETEENLLVDTLKYLAEEYRANWRGALDRAGPGPAQRLEALLSADFNPEICSPRKLAAWCAFWGRRRAGRLISSIAAPTTRNIPQLSSISAQRSSPQEDIRTIHAISRAHSMRCSRGCGSIS
jgi:hypothetical protein